VCTSFKIILDINFYFFIFRGTMTKQKIPIKLNIPKDKKLQFDEVSFVNEMSEYSLKVLVKRIWQQLMAVANVFDERRKDISLIMDKIMSGDKWTKNDVYDRFQYGVHKDFVIQYDTLKKEFILLDSTTHQPIHRPIKAISILDAKVHKKTKDELEEF